MKGRLCKNIVIYLLLISIVMANSNISYARPNDFLINTAEEFIEFTKNATLDTYFNNKTVVLGRDIDLSGQTNIQVPTFNGTFDGKGYTIKGVQIDNSGSNQGLFRYLQEDGIIKNLKVSGKVTPSGSQSVVGGIVGNNKGTIKYCYFEGDVAGKSNIGGIVGINEASGNILSCQSEGMITGEHFTGGIAGQNLGTIFKSTNISKVNTTISEDTVEVESVDWSKINSTENVGVHTDTGGVAGYSSGYIQDCINREVIGYKYIGYNVGGIVGRQSGYLKNCQNYNTVLGRKDVGGVIGQIEPHLILLFSEDTLQELNSELDVLQNLFTNSFNNVETFSHSMSNQIDRIGYSIDDTRDIVETLSSGTMDYIDGLVDTVNITSQRVRYTLEETIPILRDGESMAISLKNGLDDIGKGFANLSTTSKDMSNTFNESKKAMNNLERAISYGEDSIYDLEKALTNLLDLIERQDNIKDIGDEIGLALDNLGGSLEDVSQAISAIYNALKDVDDIDPGFDNKLPQILDELEEIEEAIKDMSKLPSRLANNIVNIIDKGISQIAGDTKKDLDNIFDNFQRASGSLKRSISNLEESFAYLEDASEESAKAFKYFSGGFGKFKDGFETMSMMIISVHDLVDSLVAEPNIELENISSEYRQSGEDLFASMRLMSDEMGKLNSIIRDGKSNTANDVRSISDQIMLIFDLLIKSRERGKTEYIEDISDADIDDAKQGVSYKNQNYGLVEGSSNIGGITGAMAVEYDIDPEDDILKEGSPSLNFKYLTTAILKGSTNHGKVIGKKDNIGGIVGRMNIGIITECENYGDIESKEGDYVGGIAGVSYTSIDSSYALSSLSGKDYIGGIGGLVNNLTNSYAMIDIKKSNECIGSIAGKSQGELTNNHYVHDSLAAVDGISYSDKASPISYSQLLEVENLPDAFTKFYITFIADGSIVDRIPFEYGDSIDEDLIPKLPNKAGYDGHWEDFAFQDMTFNSTVEAVYIPSKTVISSSITAGEDSLPLMLAEGKFDKKANLKVEAYELTKESNKISGHTILEAWDIELEGLNESYDGATIRYYLEKPGRNLSVWQDTSQGWQELNTDINGRYIIFDFSGEAGVFCISKRTPPWFILIGPILLILIVIKLVANKRSSILTYDIIG